MENAGFSVKEGLQIDPIEYLYLSRTSKKKITEKSQQKLIGNILNKQENQLTNKEIQQGKEIQEEINHLLHESQPHYYQRVSDNDLSSNKDPYAGYGFSSDNDPLDNDPLGNDPLGNDPSSGDDLLGKRNLLNLNYSDDDGFGGFYLEPPLLIKINKNKNKNENKLSFY